MPERYDTVFAKAMESPDIGRLCRDYKNQNFWIAMYRGKIIGHGNSPEDAREMAKESTKVGSLHIFPFMTALYLNLKS